MAAGDVVTNILTLVGQYVNFQPAAGVEVMLTAFSNQGGMNYIFYNGANEAWNSNQDRYMDVKVAITNTIYARFYSTATYVGYTGIQIK
jgi:hypothetical protein|tara:strand:+ start:523 stop:789 length:267 start_codon:yes stop_codon:yes gene_type:complete